LRKNVARCTWYYVGLIGAANVGRKKAERICHDKELRVLEHE